LVVSGYYRFQLCVVRVKMGRFLNFRGSALNFATIFLVVCPAYTCFGYNLAVAGGLLTLPSWLAQFPQMNTLDTTGAQNALNTNIQGTVVFSNLALQLV
jgi:hypothetical protein